MVRQAGHFTSLSFEWLLCEIGMTTWPFVATGEGNEVTNVKPVCRQSLVNHIAVGVPMMMTCPSSLHSKLLRAGTPPDSTLYPQVSLRVQSTVGAQERCSVCSQFIPLNICRQDLF